MLCKYEHKTHFQIADGMGDVLDFIENTPSPWEAPKESENPSNNDWAGGSMATAKKLAREGWPAGLEKMVSGAKALQANTNMSPAPDIILDVAGAHPCVPLACAGDPANMVDQVPIQERIRGTIDLYVSFAASALYAAHEFTNYGIALLSHIDALENSGYRVRVTGFWFGSCYGHHDYMLQIPLKEAGDHLELDRMAFALAHPTVLRRLGFACFEKNKDNEKAAGGYGSIGTPNRGVHLDEQTTVFMGVNMLDHKDLQSAEEAYKALTPHVEEALTNQFGPLPEGLYTKAALE